MVDAVTRWLDGRVVFQQRLRRQAWRSLIAGGLAITVACVAGVGAFTQPPDDRVHITIGVPPDHAAEREALVAPD